MRLTATQRNVLSYILIAIGGAVLATGLQLGVALAGDAPILLRPLASTFVNTLFGALAATFGTMLRPSIGKEGIASLVSEVGHNQAKAVLEVEAVKQATGIAPPPPLTDADIERITRRGLDLMRQSNHDATLAGDGSERRP